MFAAGIKTSTTSSINASITEGMFSKVFDYETHWHYFLSYQSTILKIFLNKVCEFVNVSFTDLYLETWHRVVYGTKNYQIRTQSNSWTL